MNLDFVLLFLMLFLFMALGLNVASSMMFSAVIYMMIHDISVFSALVQSTTAPRAQTLMSVGFFILAGGLMNTGGITMKIFNFAHDLCCWIPGGLAHANVVGSVIFAGMSGSATADAGGIGKIEIDAMTSQGYELEFSCAVTGASSILSPIIPPSIPAVLLACITGVSTGRLFTAGIVPGLVYSLGMMALIIVIAIKRGYERTKLPPLSKFWKDFVDAFFPLLTPVIILGGIYSGVVTPTEAAVMACLYAMILSLVTREMDLKGIIFTLKDSCRLLMSILYITIAANMFGYVITMEQVPRIVAEMMTANISTSTGCLLAVTVILLILGCVMDGTATIYIAAPVLFPVAIALGCDPVQFCMVFSFTLMIGVITPPFGMVLFVMQGMTGAKYGALCKALLPFMVLAVGMALLMVFCEPLTTWLPDLIYGPMM